MESNTPLSFEPERGAKTKSSEAILRRRKGEWKPKYLAKIEEHNLVTKLQDQLERQKKEMRRWNWKWLALGMFLGLALGCLVHVIVVSVVSLLIAEHILPICL